MKKLLVAALAGLSFAMSLSAASAAEDKKVVIAYQTGSVPYFVGIANGDGPPSRGRRVVFGSSRPPPHPASPGIVTNHAPASGPEWPLPSAQAARPGCASEQQPLRP